METRAGLFLAPQMVGEALKGGRLIAGKHEFHAPCLQQCEECQH